MVFFHMKGIAPNPHAKAVPREAKKIYKSGVMEVHYINDVVVLILMSSATDFLKPARHACRFFLIVVGREAV
jgi:hypothetical protein